MSADPRDPKEVFGRARGWMGNDVHLAVLCHPGERCAELILVAHRISGTDDRLFVQRREDYGIGQTVEGKTYGLLEPAGGRPTCGRAHLPDVPRALCEGDRQIEEGDTLASHLRGPIAADDRAVDPGDSLGLIPDRCISDE